jgi:hypothetical protein
MSSPKLPLINFVVQNGPNPGQSFNIKDRPQTIGRGSTNDIIIEDQSLSRVHARVRATSNGYIIEDLGSTNGTFINDARISGPAPVRPGDKIRLGTTISLMVRPGQAGAVVADRDETILEGNIPAPVTGGHTLAPDATVVPGTVSGAVDQTIVPRGGGQAAPAYPYPEQQRSPWIWVIAAIAVAVLIGGGTWGYLNYATGQPAAPAEIAQPPTPTSTATPEPTATATPGPTATPEPSATPEALGVPGLLVASALEQNAPPLIVNEIDPFCATQIEVSAEDPVFILWQQRLAEVDPETDYLAEWMAATHYDISLDGRRINSFSYYVAEGPLLNLWANLGVLPPGDHIVSIERYTSRQVSSGLDLEPSDGAVDVFGPGLAGEGSCEIVVPELIAAATPTPEPSATPEPEPTATPTEARVTVSAAPLGIFQDFESPSTWRRGDQPYGELNRSTGQAHSGSYAAQISYNFPTPDNDYVIFLQSRLLAGQPNAISAWVYGDGSGHFLNLWLKDANGQSWGMSFGQIEHTGWQEMTAFIDPSQPWPSGHISGPDNGVIDYPISFQALIVDDGSDNFIGRGTIFVDDLNSQAGITAPTGGQQPVVPAPVVSSVYGLSVGKHIYEPWGAPRGDLCDALRAQNFDDKVPMRAFNIELLLTNKSTMPVADNWLPIFVTAQGQSVRVCDNAFYRGNGPQPGATSSVTFYTQVVPGDYVRVVQLTVNNQTIQICLGPSGAQSDC